MVVPASCDSTHLCICALVLWTTCNHCTHTHYYCSYSLCTSYYASVVYCSNVLFFFSLSRSHSAFGDDAAPAADAGNPFGGDDTPAPADEANRKCRFHHEKDEMPCGVPEWLSIIVRFFLLFLLNVVIVNVCTCTMDYTHYQYFGPQQYIAILYATYTHMLKQLTCAVVFPLLSPSFRRR